MKTEKKYAILAPSLWFDVFSKKEKKKKNINQLARRPDGAVHVPGSVVCSMYGRNGSPHKTLTMT